MTLDHYHRIATRAVVLCFALVMLATNSGCVTSFRDYVSNGFKVGPNYSAPLAPVADQWIDLKTNPKNSKLSNAPPQDWAWWRVFRDPTLDELVQTAHQQNLTLREAGARIEEAQALRGITVGNLFPQSQTAFGQYRRQMLSFGTGITAGGGGGFPGATRYFSVWNTGTQLAWELDFWGKYRRAIESADAQLDASVENYDSVLVLLCGDVASTYVEIRTVEQRLAYARENVASQKGSADIAEKLREGGKGRRLDVTQAITNVAQTESTIPQLEIQLRRAENRLCVLLGIPPQDIRQLLGQSKGIPSAGPNVAINIPAELVRRRPDIRRAEREVAAQSARIGIAETELYPAFTINGQVFVQANQFRDLFNGQAVGGNIGPSFNWNVLNYLRIRNNIVVEEARFMQEVAQYQSSVLNANREAEDAVVGFLRSQEQAFALRKGADAAKESRDLVQALYDGGREPFNTVFVAQLALTQQQDNLAQAEGEIAQNLVSIYRALGGGWEIRLEDLPPMQAQPPMMVPEQPPMMRDPLMDPLPAAPVPEPEKP